LFRRLSKITCRCFTAFISETISSKVANSANFLRMERKEYSPQAQSTYL
jgi:hypothetical protein